VTALETQILFARAVVLILLYAFLGSVGLVAWRELRVASRRRPSGPGEETAVSDARAVVLSAGRSGRAAGEAFPIAAVAGVGRDLENDIVLRDPTVSSRHAVFVLRDGAWWTEDLGSRNGTWVAGARLEPMAPALTRSGDIVQLGQVRLRLVLPQAHGDADR